MQGNPIPKPIIGENEMVLYNFTSLTMEWRAELVPNTSTAHFFLCLFSFINL